MINKAKEAALGFIDKVIEYVKQLPQKVSEWLKKVVEKVGDWGANLAKKGKESAKKLYDAVVEKVGEITGKIKSIGSDIVSGLWNGINNKVQWLKDKIKSFVGDVTEWLKKFFKIGSPSKLMANEVGKWLPEGIAVGITDNAKSVLGALKDVAVTAVSGAKAGLSKATTTLGSTGAVGGTVNNFYQTINSPKQLSRLDIYRQSKNLLGYAGGGF
jgi:phage-related protein